MGNLYNLELEQGILGALIQYGNDVYVEIDYLGANDFSSINAPIFSIIKQILDNKGKADPLIVIERAQQLGVKLEGIDVGDYVNSLNITPIDKNNVKELALEIKKKTLSRQIISSAEKLIRDVKNGQNKSGTEIISMVDNCIGKSIFDFNAGENVGTNFLQELPDFIEKIGNEEGAIPSIKMPYPVWHDVLGGLSKKELFITISRRGTGKSLFMLDIARKISDSNIDKDLKILYLDSEMDYRRNALRFVCASIGVPMWLLQDHLWRKDPEWCPKIRAELEKIRNGRKNIWFQSIGNMSVKKMTNFVKAWWHREVGRDGHALIIYDYFKITENDKSESSSHKEHEQAASKCEILKDLAEYCNAPIFSALQANAKGITRNKHSEDINDDDSIAAITDRISFLANYMGILRERTHDEMINDSLPDQLASTHKLILLKYRDLGRDGPDFIKWIKVKEGKEIKYKQNYMNFNVDNFNVTSAGTYKDFLIKSGKIQLDVPVVNKDNLF